MVFWCSYPCPYLPSQNGIDGSSFFNSLSLVSFCLSVFLTEQEVTSVSQQWPIPQHKPHLWQLLKFRSARYNTIVQQNWTAFDINSKQVLLNVHLSSAKAFWNLTIQHWHRWNFNLWKRPLRGRELRLHLQLIYMIFHYSIQILNHTQKRVINITNTLKSLKKFYVTFWWTLPVMCMPHPTPQPIPDPLSLSGTQERRFIAPWKRQFYMIKWMARLALLSEEGGYKSL